MKTKKLIFQISLIIIIILYGVGLTGFLIDYTDILLPFTSYILYISFLLLLINHREWNRFFSVFILAVIIGGFVIEVIGVQTGVVFGKYQYGATLGFKIYDVPLVIGINWFLLVYSSGMTTQLIKIHKHIRALIGALLMVLVDYSLETVAQAYDFWNWQNNTIPVQNYVAWFVVAYFFHIMFQNLHLKKINRFAIVYFVIQWLFFLILSYKAD